MLWTPNVLLEALLTVLTELPALEISTFERASFLEPAMLVMKLSYHRHPAFAEAWASTTITLS
jgi:hypothetical protein